jgi:hypothetical protein
VFYISQFVLLSVSLWPWYCLSFFSFPLAMILSVFCQFPVVHDIVCLLSVFLWPWYCLSFVTSPLAMILFVFLDVRLLITSLVSSNLSCTLAKLS